MEKVCCSAAPAAKVKPNTATPADPFKDLTPSIISSNDKNSGAKTVVATSSAGCGGEPVAPKPDVPSKVAKIASNHSGEKNATGNSNAYLKINYYILNMHDSSAAPGVQSNTSNGKTKVAAKSDNPSKVRNPDSHNSKEDDKIGNSTYLHLNKNMFYF